MKFQLPHRTRTTLLATALLALGGCGGVQSALRPASVEAGTIANLFWGMTAGTVVIWLAVMLLAIYATLVSPARHSVRKARWLIIGGGAIFPVIVLTGLLIYGLALMPALRPAVSPDALRIDVSAERFWWRIEYRLPNGTRVASANEIRLPVGEAVEFRVTSPDVIHSFWIPALGGKVDAIPGRETRLVLTPTATGTYIGACAEFCGASHADMKMAVVVMETAAFAEWLQQEARPAQAPTGLAARGHRVFQANGCGACHEIRGTEADGRIGPDLTHVGDRLAIGAGALRNDREAFVRWISHPRAVKPDVNMPAFGMLARDDLRALAHYLDGLQ